MRRILFGWVFLTLFTSPLLAEAREWKRQALKLDAPLSKLIAANGDILISLIDDQWQKIEWSGAAALATPVQAPTTAALNDPDKLPDTEIATGKNDIAKVWFSGPTTRYGHAVLGDAIEAETLKAELEGGKVVSYRLAQTAVFEDRIPRLTDINGDGRDEIIAVKSYLDQGAAVILAGLVKGQLQILAEAPSIGQPNRWLNPVGAADFDGDGTREIAVVITPHIGGTLQLYEWHQNKLIPDVSDSGYSNHAMGSRELGLSAILDYNGDQIPDIVLPDASRQALIVISFAQGKARKLARIALDGRYLSGLHTTDLNGDGLPELIYADQLGQITIMSAQD